MPSLQGSSQVAATREFSGAMSKRKFADFNEESELKTESPAGDNSAPSSDENIRNGTAIDNVLEILKMYDTAPSILSLPLIDNDHATPPAKRAKPTSVPTSDSILTRAHRHQYLSLDDLVSDVSAASKQILASADYADGLTSASQPNSRPDDLSVRVAALRELLSNLVEREKQRKPLRDLLNGHSAETSDKGLTSESEEPRLEQESATNDPEPLKRRVLTLFGTAGGHKQLFSSLQRTTMKTPQPPSSSHLNMGIRMPQPLHEDDLPQGISSTTVIPLDVRDATRAKMPAPKLGDLFHPPSTLPQLAPPRTPRPNPNILGNAISWSKREDTSDTPRTGHYSTENLTTGLWLGYSSSTPAQGPSSPEAKRKQRDRALSTGEAHPRLSDGAIAAQEKAKEDALFRSVYSNFAPSLDNSAAIAPAQLRSEVWWERVGRLRYRRNCTREPTSGFSDESESDEHNTLREGVDEEAAFIKAVDAFDFESDSSQTPLLMREPENTNSESILQEISALLETLNSYQRSRHSTLASTARTPLMQTSSLHELTGNPSTPSAAETETHAKLQRRLIRLISSLPPYWVSKLNGEQFADLKISRKIVLEANEYRGIMEEDHLARAAKAAAQGASANAAGMGRNSGMNAHANTIQYGPRTANMSHTPRGGGYMPQNFHQPQNYARPQNNYARSALSNWQVSSPSNPSPQRPYNQHGYAQQTPQSAHNSYRQPGPGFYQPRPMPGPGMNGAFQPPGQPPLQRTYTPQMYPSNSPHNAPRDGSPQKPLNYVSALPQVQPTPRPPQQASDPRQPAVSRTPGTPNGPGGLSGESQTIQSSTQQESPPLNHQASEGQKTTQADVAPHAAGSPSATAVETKTEVNGIAQT